MPLNRMLMEGWLSTEEEGETGDVGRVMGRGLRTPASSSPTCTCRRNKQGGRRKRDGEKAREEEGKRDTERIKQKSPKVHLHCTYNVHVHVHVQYYYTDGH